MVLDSRFIQILTFDLVNKFDQEQNKIPAHKSGNINVAAIQKMADNVISLNKETDFSSSMASSADPMRFLFIKSDAPTSLLHSQDFPNQNQNSAKQKFYEQLMLKDKK